MPLHRPAMYVSSDPWTNGQRCPTINFFASTASAGAHHEAHPHLDDVHLLDQDTALRSGLRSFGNLLVTDESVECDEKCC